MTRPQRGMTLVELVITIVIIGIAAAALFSAMASITGRSADPMLRQQSLYIAEAYMERLLVAPVEILLEQPHDVSGEKIDELKHYRVRARLDPDVRLGNSVVGEVPATRIDVDVWAPNENPQRDRPLTLSGWRTCYDVEEGSGVCP